LAEYFLIHAIKGEIFLVSCSFFILYNYDDKITRENEIKTKRSLPSSPLVGELCFGIERTFLWAKTFKITDYIEISSWSRMVSLYKNGCFYGAIILIFINKFKNLNKIRE
jgi:hypothetical protein